MFNFSMEKVSDSVLTSGVGFGTYTMIDFNARQQVHMLKHERDQSKTLQPANGARPNVSELDYISCFN